MQSRRPLQQTPALAETRQAGPPAPVPNHRVAPVMVRCGPAVLNRLTPQVELMFEGWFLGLRGPKSFWCLVHTLQLEVGAQWILWTHSGSGGPSRAWCVTALREALLCESGPWSSPVTVELHVEQGELVEGCHHPCLLPEVAIQLLPRR